MKQNSLGPHQYLPILSASYHINGQ